MTQPIRDEDFELLRFGGGINSRASEDSIDPLECTAGENFLLDPGNGEFRPRPPIDLVGTVPNGSEIRGLVTLLKADGSVTMLVQAGDTVYKWDGASTFTSVGSVSATAKLRGPKEAVWQLADKVLIADLNQIDNIKEWDGATFSETAFLDADGSTPFPSFKAKYITVENERAFFANIKDGGGTFAHLLAASQRGDYTIVSAAKDRPSSALGADAPWFLPVPQFKPINGLAFAFGVLAISQSNGAFEKLAGNDSQDFSLKKLHDGSGASGDEAVVSTGNDIIYGAPGHVESLESTDKFGDVEFDDISFKIKDDVESYDDWTLIYNARLKRIYCFPAGTSEVWVLHTDFVGSELSPWSKWTTQHAFSFQPTVSMLCRDPVDGLEYVFMGDSSGNLYRMEGTGESGDAGSAAILAKRTSKLFSAPLDSKSFKKHGWLQYRKRLANDVSLNFLYSGEHVHDVPTEISLSAVKFDTVYNDGTVFYGGNFYYGPLHENRLIRKIFSVSGQSNQFQIQTEVESVNEFALTEIGVRYNFAG